jgi:hypothetical protein
MEASLDSSVRQLGYEYDTKRRGGIDLVQTVMKVQALLLASSMQIFVALIQSPKG